MAFMKKEVLEAEARRLGLDKELEGLTWAEQQRLVKDALDAEGRVVEKPMARTYGLRDRGPTGYSITMIAPEIEQTKIQLVKYDEDLGPENQYEEVSFSPEDFQNGTLRGDTNYATYKMAGSTGKRVVAQSTIPYEQFGERFNPETDWAPVIKDGNRIGYRWKSFGNLRGMKDLLESTGYYLDVADRFDSLKGTLWYASNKVLVCDIQTAHKAMRDIERMAAEDSALRAARRG